MDECDTSSNEHNDHDDEDIYSENTDDREFIDDDTLDSESDESRASD